MKHEYITDILHTPYSWMLVGCYLIFLLIPLILFLKKSTSHDHRFIACFNAALAVVIFLLSVWPVGLHSVLFFYAFSDPTFIFCMFLSVVILNTYLLIPFEKERPIKPVHILWLFLAPLGFWLFFITSACIMANTKGMIEVLNNQQAAIIEYRSDGVRVMVPSQDFTSAPQIIFLDTATLRLLDRYDIPIARSGLNAVQ